jgi:hypothetical protein
MEAIMKTFFRKFSITLGILLSISGLLLVPSMGMAGSPDFGKGVLMAKITPDTVVDNHEPAALDKDNPRIMAVMAIQNRHSRNLMGIPDVVGTAVGLTDVGEPAILVLTKTKAPSRTIPDMVEGVPVIEQVTGEIIAMPANAMKGGSNSTTAVWPRPVPIGISTGNAGECSAGTISARVLKNGAYYALSNNHVYALENNAAIGSEVLQPGRYDTRCRYSSSNVIGNLAAFTSINFSGGSNTVDAAIASTTTANLDNATPANGYGIPGSTIRAAALNMGVQKYGRTTKLTKGVITGINATITVSYGASGNAVFVNQIVVNSNKPFLKSGDSGSLLVTDDLDCNPVGLMFAGGSSGYGIANPIGAVLSGLGITIDGK